MNRRNSNSNDSYAEASDRNVHQLYMLNIVVSPTDPQKRKQNRRSVAYFATANGQIAMREPEFEEGIVASKDNFDERPLTVDEFVTKRMRRFSSDLKDLES